MQAFNKKSFTYSATAAALTRLSASAVNVSSVAFSLSKVCCNNSATSSWPIAAANVLKPP